ncbi:MAG: hypothetical protein HYX38_23175 [Rhodospirillales bacterium]|nr:hypothetical protein [Rhodospirillales bacterium]
MKRWIASHFGLARPFRLERTLTVVFAMLLGAVLGSAAVWYRLKGELAVGTPLGWYFAYVAGLLALAVLCARWPRVAAVTLSIAALELGLGLGSAVLYRRDITANDLLLDDDSAMRRAWHPLLQAVVPPGTSWRLTDGEIRYNSLGLRGPERTAKELSGKTVVALFGGSTTADIAVPEGRSWGERLEQILGEDRYAVINHASELYSTVQIVLQTAFYQSAFGVQPDCAVYYVGGVDVQNSHIRNLDPAYADYFTPSLIDSLRARRIDASTAVSPLLQYASRLLVLAFDTVRPPVTPTGIAAPQPDADLTDIYRRNIRTISAINRQRGIAVVWIGEIVDVPRLGDEGGAEDWAPFVRREALWAAALRAECRLAPGGGSLGRPLYRHPPLGVHEKRLRRWRALCRRGVTQVCAHGGAEDR